MDIHISDLKKISGIFGVFFPEFQIRKTGFKSDNSAELVKRLTLIIDALIKSENFRRHQNLDLPDDHDLFAKDTIGMLKNISFYLQRFETNLFRFTRTERQTFLFVIENVQEYLLNGNTEIKKEKRDDDFLDHKFWIENFFKIFDQKFSGTTLSGDDGLLFSSPLISFSLSPFAMVHKDRAAFLLGEDNGKLKYSCFEENETVLLDSGELRNELFMFRFANLDLWKGTDTMAYPGSDSDFQADVETVRSAYGLFRAGLHEKSHHLLKPVLPGFSEFPLILLLQIRNISRMNDRPPLKAALVDFTKQYPNYYQGFELLGLLHEREDDHQPAAEYYERSVKLRQNKEISGRIKKLRSIIEKNQDSREAGSGADPFINLSMKAAASGREIIARDRELREMQEILLSDSRSNLLLVGDSGVGKTALIHLLARKLNDSGAPDPLRGRQLMEINFVSLLTGTKYRGQFEEKVVRLLNDFRMQNDVLVLEDIHMMMSQGGARGTSMDLVNILKQYMRDGEIQVIATTSYEEYKNVVERDNSLLGLFQRIFIGPLSDNDTIEILKREKERALSSDNIIFSENLIREIVENSRANIAGRKQPDASLMIFDRLVSRSRLRPVTGGISGYNVTSEDLSGVISDLLNLPDPDLSFTLKNRLSTLESRINREIIGQEDAVKQLATGVIVSKLGYDIKDNRPDGVFLFVGPTGVGKSETAIVLSRFLYGSAESLVRIDMSEYMERFTYSRFVGAAPGYVGYNDSTQLTDKIRQNPYSVILLDEVEKADYQLLNIFLQVFDAGRLTDARGNIIDFSHTTIIMTSNIGTELFSRTKPGYEKDSGDDVSPSSLKKALKRFFSPEFLNRIDDIVIFKSLDRPDIRKIVQLQLEETVKKLASQGKRLSISGDLIDFIVENGYSKEYGARNISRTIKSLVLEKIAALALEPVWEEYNFINCRLKDGEPVADITVLPEDDNEGVRINMNEKNIEKEGMKNG